LTLEPALLGLLVAFSWSGLAIGLAAFVAFLVRTPLKLAVVDHRRRRSLPRTRLATRVAGIELSLLGLLGVSALWMVLAARAVAVAALAMAQSIAIRREHIPPVKVIGLRQMAAGLAGVASTALGVRA
jgi:hypothetical protein